MELSRLQQLIINAPCNKTVVISSSASGKTRVLTEKVRQILRAGANPRDIAVITFTNMAAAELRQRLGDDYKEGLFVGTIHALANYMLCMGGVDTKKVLNDERFDELFELIKENPSCVRHLEWILLDEAQDSDKSQFQFLFEMIKPDCFFVVGDPKQMIYSFRGSDSTLMTRLGNMPGARIFDMNENYRNGKEILSFAKRLIRPTGLIDTSSPMPFAPEVEHYTCTGWDKDFSYITSDLVVKAVYEPNKYSVSFYGMGGVWILSLQVEYGGNATAPAAPYVDGYNFVGWLSSEGGDLMSSEEVNAAIVTNDISYTAQYESTVKTYSLKLEVEGNGKLYFGMYNAFGELMEAEATESEYNLPEGSQFIIIAKPDEGWLFAQWNDGLTRDRRNITLTSDLTLKAIFTDDPDGISSLAGSSSNEDGVKVVRNGKIYILRNGKLYTVDGYEVSLKRLGR